MKRIRKGIKYALMLLLVLILALFLLPFFFQDEFKESVKTYLNERIDAEVDFSDIHLSALRQFPKLSLGIDDLSVKKNAGFANDTVLYSKFISLEMPIYSLWENKKPIEVNKVHINEARIFIGINEDGEKNYELFSETNTSASSNALDFNVQAYKISDSKLVYDDQQSGISLLLEELNHEGKGDFSQSNFAIDTKTNISKVNYTQNDIEIIDDWSANAEGTILADMNTNRYTFENNTLLLNKLELFVNGLFQLNENDTDFDIQLKTVKNDFKNYLSLLPNVQTQAFDKIKAHGTADVDALIKGKFIPENNTYPRFNVQSIIQNGFVHFPDFDIPIQDIAGKLKINNPGNSLDDTELELVNFQSSIGGKSLKMNARARDLIKNPLIDARIEGDIDLANILKAYPLPEVKDMEGIVSADIFLQGTRAQIESNKIDDISFEGNLKAQALRINLADRPEIRIPVLETDWNKEEMNITSFSYQEENTDISMAGKIMKPLDLLMEDRDINGELLINAKRLDLNQYMAETSDSLNTNTNWMNRLKKLNLLWEAEIGEINYENYTLLNNRAGGQLSNDELRIDNYEAILSGSDLKLNGELENVISYSTDADTIRGCLNLASNLMNVKALLNAQATEESSAENIYPTIPPRMNIEIRSKADQLQYGYLELAEISGDIQLESAQLNMKNFQADLLGGKIKLDGSYQQTGTDAPEFAFRYSMEELPFQAAYQSLPSIQQLAPIFSFIEGAFNTTLIMNGSLNKDLLPRLTDLTAAGYMETVNGKIRSFPFVDKINQFFTVNMEDAWQLTNTKNWFDIEDGTITLKEYSHSWKDMEFTIAGQHSLDKQMNYKIKAKVPRNKLNKSAIGKELNSAIDGLIGQAVSSGILKSDAQQFILLDFDLSGDLKNPIVSVKPKGVEGLEFSNPLDPVIANAKEQVTDTIQTTIEEAQEKVESKIEEQMGEIKDTLTGELEEKAEEVLSQGKDKLQTVLDSSLQNQVPEIVPDSLKDKVDKTIDDLFGDKPKEDIKDKLKDFNPFKKKKKNN